MYSILVHNAWNRKCFQKITMLELYKCMQSYNETKCNYNGLSKQTEQRQFCHQRRRHRLEAGRHLLLNTEAPTAANYQCIFVSSSLKMRTSSTSCIAIQQHLSKDAKMDQQSMSVSRSKDSSNRSILFSSKSLPQPISQQISLQARAG